MTTLVAVTMYLALDAAPLYCGGVVDYAADWVAWDFAVNGGQCGDIFSIEVDGVTREYPALDSGRFGRHCVMQLDGTCPRIAVDVPHHVAWFDGMSTVGKVVNLSERARYEEYPE